MRHFDAAGSRGQTPGGVRLDPLDVVAEDFGYVFGVVDQLFSGPRVSFQFAAVDQPPPTPPIAVVAPCSRLGRPPREAGGSGLYRRASVTGTVYGSWKCAV